MIPRSLLPQSHLSNHPRFERSNILHLDLPTMKWFNTLNQPMMICIWVRAREDATPFQYFLNMIDWNYPNYLPRWRIFVENCDNLPKNTLRWKEPSTIWKGHPAIGFMSDTDFKNSKRQSSCRSWFSTLPSHVVLSTCTENISFGMDVTHIRENAETDKDALIAQCPIVRFKASTVMQRMRITASRTILPPSDVKAGSRERTYRPSTYHYGYGYDTPTECSDTLSP